MMSRYLVMRATSTDEDWNADIDAAFVEVTPELVRQWLALLDAAAEFKTRHAGLASLAFFENVFWVSLYLKQETEWDSKAESIASELDEGKDYLLVEIDLPDEAVQRTQGDAVNVWPAMNAIGFEASPRHAAIGVETGFLTREQLQEILACCRPPQVRPASQ